jgi:branched-chain amino acid transport system substrate-binding protein
MAALGYDSAMVLADAITARWHHRRRQGPRRLGRDRGLPLRHRQDDARQRQRNASKAAVIITVEDGKFKYLETIQP